LARRKSAQFGIDEFFGAHTGSASGLVVSPAPRSFQSVFDRTQKVEGRSDLCAKSGIDVPNQGLVCVSAQALDCPTPVSH
jgi:hypothetical protein